MISCIRKLSSSFSHLCSLAQISNSLEPILKNRTTVESLKKLPDTIQPLAELGDLIDFEAVANFTGKYWVNEVSLGTTGYHWVPLGTMTNP